MSRQADYRRRQQAKGLVQVNLWVRPEHKERLREFVAKLNEDAVTSDASEDAVTSDTSEDAVTSDTSEDAVTSDELQKKIDRDIPPLPRDVEELLRRKEQAQAERARKRAERKRADVTSDKPKKKPIPQRITENPAQLRRVMQYHHPDKGNPDARRDLYERAVNKLKRVKAMHKHWKENGVMT